MDRNTLWSLRLGFSGKQSDVLVKKGIKTFLKESYSAPFDRSIPTFLPDEPMTLVERRALRKKLKTKSQEVQKEVRRENRRRFREMKVWWLEKMQSEQYPLREKMVCFWHNHFVSTAKKVKVNYFIYQHNQTLRENAFGNFRELTKLMVRSNAMIRYLDNDDNRAEKINENLSRELLELFTLGIGNYTEQDIKNGAKGLAGLSLGNDQGMYRPHRMDNSEITYFEQKGVFKVDELVDIIFQQKEAPYLITRKILQWFIYDNPDEQLVKKYGDFLRDQDFEIEPLLTKIFTEEFSKDNAGSKIKSPLVFAIQLMDTFPNHPIEKDQAVRFLASQGMDLFNQPNVKGWDGGRSWLTAQVYLQRNKVIDLFCAGRTIKKLMRGGGMHQPKDETPVDVKIAWDKNQKSKAIIKSFTDQLLFQVDEPLQNDLEQILKYDFDSKAENADEGIVRLLNFILKTPEFQLV